MVNGKWISANMSCIVYGNVGVLCLEVRARVSHYKWPVLWKGWLMQILWSWHHNAVNKCISPAINLFRDVLYPSVWEISAQSHFRVRTLPLVFWVNTTQDTYMTRHFTCYCGNPCIITVPFTVIFYGDRKAWMLTICSQLHINNPAIK